MHGSPGHSGSACDNGLDNVPRLFLEEETFERMVLLWEEIARQFGAYSDCVAFELLNEVTEQRFMPAWSRILRTCIGRIRRFAPDTAVLAGSYENNSARTVQYLDIPDDENVIYNMHCYEPLKFTHQGAYWTEVINPEERIPFSESHITPEYFENLFASAIDKAKKHHTVLYCGEYGVIDRVSPEDTLAWFRTIHDVFEKHGIARCAWSYKEMDFGLSDARLNSVREEILKNL